MEPKVILSLFDYSGAWTQAYADAGHEVILIDVKHDPELHDIARFDVSYLTETLGIEWVDGIISAPLCTHFTLAGSQYWPAKDADGRTEASVHLVRQTLRCVEYFKPDFWVLENPVGRLPRLVPELGAPAFRFDPCDFAGGLDVTMTAAELEQLQDMTTWYDRGREFAAADVALVRRSNRYTKRTCLWGHFNAPDLAHRLPIRVCKQGSWLQRLGGNSGESGRAARSETPAGFSQAFYSANDWSTAAVFGWGGSALDRIEVEEFAQT